jgi:hypothetical protein
VGRASLSVDGSYSGIRTVDTWHVSLHPNATCTQLTANGEQPAGVSVSFTEPLPLLVEALPIAQPAAILLKGDSLVSGCAEVPALAADEIGHITVPLTDLPLSLEDVELPIALGGDGTMGLRDGVGDSLPALLDSFSDNQAWDVTALLDAMIASATASDIQLELNRARAAQTWDTVLWQKLSPRNERPLRDPLRIWVETAIEELGGKAAFELALELSPTDGSPRVVVGRVASRDPATCGVTLESPLSRATEAQDRLVWSSTLSWNEGTLLGCLAEKSAAVTFPAATTVPRALDLSIDCAGVGTTLASAEDLAGTAATLCGAACLASLCQKGLETMWNRGVLSAGGDSLASMTISAAGTMGLNADAEPESSEGTWVGILTTPVTSVSVSGLLTTP